MFTKILIANRGEIACRIMRTARRLGIGTVAVYSEADEGALHVEMADEAVAIGAAPARASYLNATAIIQAAKASGSEAVHPGFGFLSENAAFARALTEAGIVFIGPTAEAIQAMGDKIESKRLAKAAGVSTVPGHIGVVPDSDAAVRIAREIGYPVMLKASAGGGGKGMRIAHDDAGVVEGFQSAASEARNSFGDARLFIERYIQEPRHIEIQVLGDAHGNIVHLGERECSIQRRHQKVIEEAPSPFLDAPTRHAMGEQAVALARAVAYRSAGTVEFIVDGQRNFYFLEMNTRLQVEHPVTEMVTGIDLVEEMIRVAAGEPLRHQQKDIRCHGSAIEARIYAEDPVRNFVPSTGRLQRYRPPPESDGVRIDAGVVEGSEISMFYDPMIAKLVTHGPDRAIAIARMRRALDGFQIRGIAHNVTFLGAVLASARFAEGRLSTDFIAEEFPEGFALTAGPAGADMVAVAALVHLRMVERAATISGQVAGRRRAAAPLGEGGSGAATSLSAAAPPSSSPGAPRRQPVGAAWVVALDGEHHAVSVRPTDAGADVEQAGRVRAVRGAWRPGDRLFSGTIDGRPLTMQVDQVGIAYRLSGDGSAATALVLPPHAARLALLMPVKQPPDTSKFLLSPMPGLLVSLAVAAGQAVEAGQALAVVEAMKMENVLRAERHGVIRRLDAQPGDSLRADQVILEFE
ncbi:MAG: acetyl/propionyl/methylcrotonyl-CoA carboxylase subunit alpha [Alphaproteobacteria bacterium]|nr:acetyl/propionyl/methylcrotonyl-CoA carboxylase subunit alpha [Alphaproteobacteria bacterium]